MGKKDRILKRMKRTEHDKKSRLLARRRTDNAELDIVLSDLIKIGALTRPPENDGGAMTVGTKHLRPTKKFIKQYDEDLDWTLAHIEEGDNTGTRAGLMDDARTARNGDMRFDLAEAIVVRALRRTIIGFIGSTKPGTLAKLVDPKTGARQWNAIGSATVLVYFWFQPDRNEVDEIVKEAGLSFDFAPFEGTI